jgi:Tol biopolymer transport system component
VAGSRVALENGSYRVFTVGLDGTGLQDTGHNAVSMSASAYSYTTSVGAHFVGDRAIFSESKADTATTTTSTLFSVPASGLGAEPLGSSTTGIFLPVIDAIGSKFVSIFYTGGRFSVALNDALTPGTVDLDRGGSATYYMGHTTDRVLLVRWSGANQYDLFAANLDGSSVATLGATVESSLGEIAATAAPVGDRVLYRTSASGSAELWSVKPDGTSPIQLTRGSGDKFAAALHGTTVVYRRVTSGQGDLYAVEIDGTNHRTLVESVLDERYGLLAGETVVYSQVSGADSNLWAVPLAGGTSVQLTSGAGVRYVSAAY